MSNNLCYRYLSLYLGLTLLKDLAGYDILIDDEMIPASFGSEQRLNIDRRLNYLLSN